MVMMLLGLVVFIGIHVVASLRGLRARLIEQLGTAGYRGFFALLATSGLGLIVYGYALWRAQGPAIVWDPPTGLRHLTLLLVLLACLALPAAVIPSHIRAVLKFPVLVAVKLWAVGHLLANGDIASIVLFGAILLWAAYTRVAMKRRGAPLPVAPKGWGGDVMVIVAGLALYLVLAYLFHPYVIGVPVI